MTERRYLIRPDFLFEVYFAYVGNISDVLIIHQNEFFICKTFNLIFVCPCIVI